MRIRQHVNPLLPQFEVFRGDLPVFPPGALIEAEVGCADAQFLFERASHTPERFYLGIEIREELVHWVNRKATRLNAPVCAVFCHAQHHLPQVLQGRTLERAYLNFPDPWFKTKHHNRRMIDDRLISALADAMAPGAELLMQTDVWEVAIDALAVIEREPRYANRAGEWSFWRGGNPYGVRSWREQNAEETGLPIWRLWFTRGQDPIV